MDRKSVVEKARSYLGVPFLHQGRSRLGVDCIGLIWCVAHDLGWRVPMEVPTYSRDPEPERLFLGFSEYLVRVPRDPIMGDIIILKFFDVPCHVGIRTDYGIIHSFSTVGKVVEHRFIGSFRHDFDSTWSFPELVNG